MSESQLQPLSWGPKDAMGGVMDDQRLAEIKVLLQTEEGAGELARIGLRLLDECERWRLAYLNEKEEHKKVIKYSANLEEALEIYAEPSRWYRPYGELSSRTAFRSPNDDFENGWLIARRSLEQK